MKTIISFRCLRTLLLLLTLTLAATASVQGQSTYTNAVAGGQWGKAINWSPNGIPNAVDAVVTLGSVSVISTNTPENIAAAGACLLYTSPSPRDGLLSRMPSSA